MTGFHANKIRFFWRESNDGFIIFPLLYRAKSMNQMVSKVNKVVDIST